MSSEDPEVLPHWIDGPVSAHALEFNASGDYGFFAVCYASKYPVDGLIAIAPGGNVGGKNFRNKLASSVEKAKKLIASGKCNKQATFSDLEGARGVTEVHAPPAAYLTWFDPDGAMNSRNSATRISANIPILWIVAKDDYEGLRKANIHNYGGGK